MTATHVTESAKRPRAVSRKTDPAELQAHRAADVVASGGSVAGWSFSSVSSRADVHRDEISEREKELAIQAAQKTDSKSTGEKVAAGAQKAGEAALKTPLGKDLQQRLRDRPDVKAVEEFVDSTPGKIAIGSVALAGAGVLVATSQPLPIGIPAIPLSSTVSLKPAITGPLDRPTGISLTLTISEKSAPDKKGPSSADAVRADIARIKKDNAWLTDAIEKARAEHGAAPQQPVQRDAVPGASSGAVLDHGSVDAALSGGGRPLDSLTRRTMESRFGYNFGSVRLHDGATPADAARGLQASAFTVGEDIVFGAGAYDPASAQGQHVLAHELAHVVQQHGGSDGVVRRQMIGYLPPTPTPFPAGTGQQLGEAGAVLAAFYVFARQVPGLLDALAGWKTIAVGKTAAGKSSFGDSLIWSSNGDWGLPKNFFNSKGWQVWQFDTGESGTPTGDATTGHAEQRLLEIAETEGAVVKAIAVSRTPCGSCAEAISAYGQKHGQVLVGVLPPPPAPVRKKAPEDEKEKDKKKKEDSQKKEQTDTTVPEPVPAAPKGQPTPVGQNARMLAESTLESLRQLSEQLEGHHRILEKGLRDGTIISFVGFWVNRVNNGPMPQLSVWNPVHSALLHARGLILENRLAEATTTLQEAATAYAGAASEFLAWKDGIGPAGVQAERQIAIAAALAIIAFVAPSTVPTVLKVGSFGSILGSIGQLARMTAVVAPVLAGAK